MFRLMLSPLGLTTVNRDAILEVTTDEVAGNRRLAVVYDVSDLCRTEEQTNTLIDVLQNETDGEWETIDGIGGSISMPRVGTQVLRQTERVHREIAGILEQLRQTLKGEPLKDPETTHDEVLETRYYHMPQQQAHDLSTLLPTLIETATWRGLNTDGIGRIAVIADDPKLTPVGKASPAAELPRGILMIRHQRSVLKKIERFLAEISRERSGAFGFGATPIGFSSVTGRSD
jgi:hypothetical protein